MKQSFIAGMILLVGFIVSCVSIDEISYKRLDSKVNIVKVFVVDKESSLKYPNLHEDFLDAVQILAKHIPVHFVITYDNIGGTSVAFDDLGSTKYKLPNVYGIYYYQGYGSIILDDDLEESPRFGAYGRFGISVAMHEILHHLGMPHIVGPGTALPDTFEVESDELAQLHLMYPISTGVQRLTPLEINLLCEKLDIPPGCRHKSGYVSIFAIPLDEEIVDVPAGDPEGSDSEAK